MVVCPKCNLRYDEGKKFCRRCGSFLLTTEEAPGPQEGRVKAAGAKERAELICPKCKALYRIGNYCRSCGALLLERPRPKETDVQTLEKKLIKKWSKQWLKLSEEKKKLRRCLEKLELQKGKVSSDLVDPMSIRYQNQLESLSTLSKGVEAELESVGERIAHQIHLLERELEPIRKRLAQFRSLYESGAMTKVDYLRQKKEATEAIKSRERSLNRYEHLLSILPVKFGGTGSSPPAFERMFRPLPLMVVAGVVLFIAMGAFFTWQRSTLTKEKSSPPSSYASPQTHLERLSSAGVESAEDSAIKSLFENIRKANLQKDIELFMSCYAKNFRGRNEKRLATLDIWKKLDYLSLLYDVKHQVVSGDTANVRVEWLIRTSAKETGKSEETQALLDVTLTREQGHWKIKEVRSAR